MLLQAFVMVREVRWRFLHAADLHLDTPFSGITDVNEEVASALRDASLEAFDRLVETALERSATFVVLAGDIYDGPERGVRAQLRFAKGLERLAGAGVRTFVAHGNHDPIGVGWSALSGRWPELVTVFGSSAVESVPVELSGEQVAVVHGISYSRREETRNLSLLFPGASPAASSDLGAGGLQVGVLHCNVGSNGEHASYAPCSIDDLRSRGIDYWALGHIHRRQIVCSGGSGSGDPWVVYPGNTQARSPKPSECGPKGALLVEVDGLEVADLEFVPLDGVRFATVDLDVSDLSDLDELVGRLSEKASSCLREAEGRKLVMRAVLRGDGALNGLLSRPDSLSGVLNALRDDVDFSNDGLWWDSIDDQTSPVIDLDSLRKRADFNGELVRFADGLLNDRTSLDRLVAELHKEMSSSRLKRLGVDVAQLPAEMIVERALSIALRALGGDGTGDDRA